MVGRGASAGGQVILARNEDFTRNNWNKYLAYRHLPQYAVPGTPSVAEGVWTLGNGLAVPVPARRFAYSAMPDAAGPSEASHGIGDDFFFEERGVNDRNVAVSATNSMATNPKAAAADPFGSVGVAESVIPTLVLPQAESARHGASLLGDHVTRFGAIEPNGVLIGDPDECWYVEIGSARHWVAVRVPDGAYLAVANGMRVHDVDLDSDRVLHSPGLFEFAVRAGLPGELDRHRFNFAQAFGVLGLPYNNDRIWLAQSLLTPSLCQQPRLRQYPMFLEPDSPVQVTEIMRVLRATYAGTVLDGKADRPIGYEKTAESHVITLDRAMPPELAGLIWQTVSTPLDAPYMPLYSAMTDVPASYSRGGNEFTPGSAYWAFHGAHALRALAKPDTGPWWAGFEQDCVEQAAVMRSTLADAYRTHRRVAVELARRYSAGTAVEAVDGASRATANLLTDIAATGGTSHALAVSAVASA
jgi:dipeptidase